MPGPISGGPSFDPASPGAIGGTTPAAITGTTITATTQIVAPNGTSTSGGITFSLWNGYNSQLYARAINGVSMGANGTVLWEFISGTGLQLNSATPMMVKFCNGSPASVAADVAIHRNAAGVLEVNSGSAGTFRDLITRSTFGNDVAGTTGMKLGVAAANTADSSAISNTTTPTAFSVTKSIVTAAFIAGKPIKFAALLKYSTAAVPGTLTLKVQLIKTGPTSVEMSTSGALVVTGSQTNQGILVEGWFVPRTLGAAGTIASHVLFDVSSDSLVIGASLSRIVASGTAKVVDTTATQVLTLEATWATADASNTILIESLITE